MSRTTLSPHVRRLVREALAEDIGSGDVTSLALLKRAEQIRAVIVCREAGVVCGTAIAAEVFKEADYRNRVRPLTRDSRKVSKGSRILSVEGSAVSILAAERTALNFLQRLSGIASLTAKYVRAVRGTRCKILDTRKTTPGWRELEKCAVACGGGTNHRFRLDELVLIKDNHLAALENFQDPIREAIRRARNGYPRLEVEVECDRLNQVRQALAARADILLLDNMSLAGLRKAVRLVRGKTKLEASGGMSLGRVRAVAKTGVNYISVGALTHSAPALDFSLEIEK